MKYGKKLLFALVFSLLATQTALAEAEADKPAAAEETDSANPEAPQEETETQKPAFFDNEEINRIIDENYEEVLEEAS